MCKTGCAMATQIRKLYLVYKNIYQNSLRETTLSNVNSTV